MWMVQPDLSNINVPIVHYFHDFCLVYAWCCIFVALHCNVSAAAESEWWKWCFQRVMQTVSSRVPTRDVFREKDDATTSTTAGTAATSCNAVRLNQRSTTFFPRDAMLARYTCMVYSVYFRPTLLYCAVCLSKRLNKASWDFGAKNCFLVSAVSRQMFPRWNFIS